MSILKTLINAMVAGVIFIPRMGMAVPVAEEIAGDNIKVTASSTFGQEQSERHLIDGSGMNGLMHDNHSGAATMWHTKDRPAATRAAEGLALSPAWVRFDFAKPVVLGKVCIWNHNQSELTDRGFRKTHILGSGDGVKWFPLAADGKEVVEIARANGEQQIPPTLKLKTCNQPVKSVVLAADSRDGNYGNPYYGLSEVKFFTSREVAEADLPKPTGMVCEVRPFYAYRPDGKGGREVSVQLKGGKLYQDATFTVDCGGVKEMAKAAANSLGNDRFTVLLPPGVGVEKACEVKISLVSGRTSLQATAKVPVQRQWTVYILMHSHVDIGYTDIQPHIAAKQAHNVVRALELIKKTKDYPEGSRFKWNIEVLWPAEQFYKIASEEQKKEFVQAVHDGNIGIDAMYGNLLTGLSRGEELLRQCKFAADLGRQCGVKVDSMMISDVPGLTWGLLPALAQNGVKYISDGPNPSDRIGYVRVQYENAPFYWISPSGLEKMLYWGSQGGYAIGHRNQPIIRTLAGLYPELEKAGYPYDTIQLRWTRGDNGPPDEAVMPAVRDWNARYVYPKLIIATTSEAFHAFEERHGKQLPAMRGDMTPYWEDGAPSSARETGMNRHSVDRLLQAETLWALRNPGRFPADDFDSAWKNSAMYSEHTWGAYNSVSQPELKFVKDQWYYKQKYALDADAESRKVMAGACAVSQPMANTVDVYNTTSWARTDLVTLPKETQGECVKDEKGDVVPTQRLSTGELVFLASEVPALGARRYSISARKVSTGGAKINGTTLSTPQLSVKLDEKTGGIISLRRAGMEMELAKDQSNSYLYLPGGNVKKVESNGPVKISVKENGPLVVSLLVESDAPGCNKLAREVRLVDGIDRVEIVDMIDKKAVRAIEGVHLGFSFNVPDPQVRINSPGVIGQIEKDQLPGACKNWFSVERFVDISNGQYGVTLSSADAPLVEVGGLTANLPRSQPNPNAYMRTIAPSSTIYAWVMNNHWHTNYRAYQDGPTWFRFAIWPHKTYDPIAATHFGVESTMPLIAVRACGDAPLASRLQVKGDGVIVSAFKPSDDGKSTIVRLYNPTDQDREVELDWSKPEPTEVTLSDASEQPGKPVTGKIPVPSKGIITVRAVVKK